MVRGWVLICLTKMRYVASPPLTPPPVPATPHLCQATLEHTPGTPWVCTEELSLGRCPAVAHYVPGSGVLPGTPVLLETLDAAYPVGLGYSKYLVRQH